MFDTRTIMVALATHLVFGSIIMTLMSSKMPSRSGLIEWAGGSMAFGIALYSRVFIPTSAKLTYIFDLIMVAGAIAYIVGLRRFLFRPARIRIATGIFIGFAVIHLAIVLTQSQAVRYIVLNTTLGGLYLWLSSDAFRGAAAEQKNRGLMAALVTIGFMFGATGITTLSRNYFILRNGIDYIFNSVYASLYYGGGIAMALTISMLLTWMVFLRLTAQLSELAKRDELTRVLNRNGLNEAIDKHFEARPARSLIFVLLDIDHFMSINDDHGHARGDLVLRAVGAELLEHCSGEDFVARTGGEEFLLVCNAAEISTARELADRLRHSIAALPLTTSRGAQLHCTASVGISHPCTHLKGWHGAVEQADKALYHAKRTGRNRTVAYADLSMAQA